MNTNRTITNRAIAGVGLGGLLLLVGGGLHPRPGDGIDEVDLAIADMASKGGWYPAHIAMGLAFVVIGLSLATLIRSAWPESSRLRTLGWVAVAGTALGALDSIPHTLAETEIAKLVSGGSTPFSDLHLITQAFATPVFGIGVAILAVFGARERVLGHWSFAVLGLLGGAAWTFAGPGVALGSKDAAALFASGFLISWFLIISAVKAGAGSRRARQTLDTEPAVAV